MSFNPHGTVGRSESSRRSVSAGFVAGVVAFLTGTALTLVFPSDAPDGGWRWAVRSYLKGHRFRFNPSGPSYFRPEEALSAVDPPVVVPLLLVAVAAAVGVWRDTYGTNVGTALSATLSVAMGYLLAATIGLVESGVRPGLGLIVGTGLLLALAVYVGSETTRRLTGGLDFIGVTSLGTLVLVGLFVIVVGLSLLQTLYPLALVTAAGCVLGGSLAVGTRSTYRLVSER